MNTATGIAVALAIVVAVGFMFFGSNFFALFEPALSEPSALEVNTNTMNDTNGTAGDSMQASPASAPATAVAPKATEPTGPAAKAGDTVTVSYVGKLQDGTVFDASANHGGTFTFTVGVGQVIKGWDEGIVGMRVGDKKQLVVPPEKGYGAQAVGSIPPNSTLIFDVEMFKIGK